MGLAPISYKYIVEHNFVEVYLRVPSAYCFNMLIECMKMTSYYVVSELLTLNIHISLLVTKDVNESSYSNLDS